MASSLTKKYNETEMTQMLEELLFAGERIETALYCLYKDTGFFASNRHVTAGYVALTDGNRLIGYKMGLFNTATVSLDMEYLTKIKISNSILGQKIVYMAFNNGEKSEVKFQIAPKIMGSKFPNQQRNMEIMLDMLREK